MEEYQVSAARRRTNLHNDPHNRLSQRPQQKSGGTLGGLHENLGSSLTYSNRKRFASQDEGKPKRALNGSDAHDIVHSDSEDEMDFLSQSSREPSVVPISPPKKKVVEKMKGKEKTQQTGYQAMDGTFHEYHPDYKPSTSLKGLSFKKNKATSSGPKENNSGSSKPPGTDSGMSKSSYPESSQTTAEAKPRPRPRPMTKSTLKDADTDASLEAPRGQPRSKRYTRKPSALVVDDDSDPPGSTSKTATSRRQSVVVIDVPSSTSTPTKPTRVSDPFSTLSPLASHSSTKAVVGDPAPFPSSSESQKPELHVSSLIKSIKNTYPDLSPLSSPVKEPSSSFPCLSPLGQEKSKKKHSFPVPSPLREGSKSRTDSAKENTLGTKRSNVKPHPMSSQITSDVSEPQQARGKRSSEGGTSDSDREWKKSRQAGQEPSFLRSPDLEYNAENDSLFLDPTVDPRTLCPYCDEPLPSSPTPTLSRLLASTKEKSSRDPRPTNPLGRKAPVGVFVNLCQRHRFESELLPEAERKGWPKDIAWDDVEGRVRSMRDELKDLIDDDQFHSDYEEPDPEDEDEDDLSESWLSPKTRCIFWREAMREVKIKGKNAAAGIRNQFATFEKQQPGYYGEQGSVIIHQTLLDLFPPSSIPPSVVNPLTPAEFLQRILIPEVGLCLILQDRALGTGHKAVVDGLRVMRESAAYGVAMFPVDEGAEAAAFTKGGTKAKEAGVADRMAMERARKRRKELEEERGDLEDDTDWEEQRKPRRKERRKQKRRDTEPAIPLAEPPRPRPRPVPVKPANTSGDLVRDSSSSPLSDSDSSSKKAQKSRRPRQLGPDDSDDSEFPPAIAVPRNKRLEGLRASRTRPPPASAPKHPGPSSGSDMDVDDATPRPPPRRVPENTKPPSPEPKKSSTQPGLTPMERARRRIEEEAARKAQEPQSSAPPPPSTALIEIHSSGDEDSASETRDRRKKDPKDGFGWLLSSQ